MSTPVLRPPSTNGAMAPLPFEVLQSKAATKVTVFVYGLPGSGKTNLLRTIVLEPRLLPALLLVCDNGHASIIDLVDNQKLSATLIADTPKKSALTQVDEILTWLSSNPGRFKSLLVDNVTELHRGFLFGQAEGRARSKQVSEYEMTQSDYGIARNQVLKQISRMSSLPISVFVTALAAPHYDEQTGLTTMEPHLSGKLGVEVPGFFDVVAFQTRKPPTANERRQAAAEGKIMDDQMVLQVNQTSTVIEARNRGNRLGREPLINPTIPQIFQAYVAAPKPAAPINKEN